MLRLSGVFSMHRPRPQIALGEEAWGRARGVRVEAAGVEAWDSVLPVRLRALRAECEAQGWFCDLNDLPQGAKRLLELASAASVDPASEASTASDPFLRRVGVSALQWGAGVTGGLAFLGATCLAVSKFAVGRGRYRPDDFRGVLRRVGPQALGILTVVSLLVGAILAFVGSIQLGMFGAEVYVADLVGLSMVMEMGALMTGIILAGRTGASFAAHLGAMQVNEEIDALRTLGVPPVEYLVAPRVVALGLMTPLLVIYADVLGIAGGAVVGVGLLEISPAVYFDQTFRLITPFLFSQGLIKGATYGVLVALFGCGRGLSCGRNASAVGEAATSAVVGSIVGIVCADAIWTYIFLHLPS